MDFLRQRGIFDPSTFPWSVTVIGAGGIGSSVLLGLVKLGVKDIIIFDDDCLESHNIPNQILYYESDVGRSKVEAAASHLSAIDNSVRITTHERRIREDDELEGIVIAAVDSMTSRELIWGIANLNPFVPLFIDGRIGGEILEVFTVQPSDTEEGERYEASLFPESEASQLPCTERAIIHTAFLVGGLIVQQIVRWHRDEAWYPRLTMSAKSMQLLRQGVPLQ